MDEVLRALAAAEQFYRERQPTSWVPRYLQDRGLPPDTAGYAPPGWRTTTDHLRAQGFSDQVLQDAGISKTARTGQLIDVVRDRATVPIRTDAGVVAFTARTRGTDQPKWINTPGTDLFAKRATLLTDARGIAPSPRAMPILVEGAFDVAAVEAATARMHVYAAAPCGTALTSQHVDRVYTQHSPSTPVMVGLDSDRAGRAATLEAWERLTRHPEFKGRQLLVAEWPNGTDPGDLAQANAEAELRHAILRARPLAERVIELRIGTQVHASDNRARALEAARHVISTDLDAVHARSWDRWAGHLGQYLGLEHSTIGGLIGDHISPPQPTPVLDAGFPPLTTTATAPTVTSSELPRTRPPAPPRAPTRTR